MSATFIDDDGLAKVRTKSVGSNGNSPKVDADGNIYTVQANVEQTIGGVLPAKAVLMGISDGTNIRAMQGNTKGTLLASAARTVTTTSPTQNNYNAKGVLIFLRVTAASGTGGLIVRLSSVDPVSGGDALLTIPPTAITATGLYVYELYPGSNGAAVTGSFALSQRTSGALPPTWMAYVQAGDATSYTYSLGYSLIL